MGGEANVIALHVVVVCLSLFVAWGRLRRVPLRQSGEFLNRPRWGSSHRKMRRERMPKNMYPRPHSGLVCGFGDVVLHDLHGEGVAARSDEYSRTA
jgi:hypothetical protein